MIAAALSRERQFAGRFVIKPCDLDDPSTWSRVFPPGTMQLVRIFSDWEREKVRRFRAAGYAVCDLLGDASRRIAATDIRAAMSSGREWARLVPPGTREWLLARHAPDSHAQAASGRVLQA